MAWTIPRTWVSGEIVTAANMNIHVRDNLLAISGAWLTYTPTWSGTIGNGSIAGAYARSSGRSINFRVTVLWGSTTSHTGGVSQTVTLPFTTAAAYSTGFGIGWGGCYDASATASAGNGIVVIYGANTVAVQGGGGIANWLNNSPMTWATGDILYVHGTYECTTD